MPVVPSGLRVNVDVWPDAPPQALESVVVATTRSGSDQSPGSCIARLCSGRVRAPGYARPCPAPSAGPSCACSAWTSWEWIQESSE
jgi:hypothetical protein